MTIISASRRTDIPAFFPDWFMKQVREGAVEVKNPFNNTSREVSLKAEAVTAFVFWTRNPLPLLPFLPELTERGYRHYFLMSLTGMGEPLERRNPPLEVAVEGFLRAAEGSPVHWRFDPILYDGSKESANEVLERFSRIAVQLQGATQKCHISFMQPYRKQMQRFQEIGYEYCEATETERKELAFEIGMTAKKFDIEVFSCCSSYLESGIAKPGSCIDRATLEEITGSPVLDKVQPSRKDCNCIKSVDIGIYNTCLHECLYCYATGKYETAFRNARSLQEGFIYKGKP